VFSKTARNALNEGDLLQVTFTPNADAIMQPHADARAERELVIHRPRNQSRHVMAIGRMPRNRHDYPARELAYQLSFQSKLESRTARRNLTFTRVRSPFSLFTDS